MNQNLTIGDSPLSKIGSQIVQAPLWVFISIAFFLRILAFWFLGDQNFPDSLLYMEAGENLRQGNLISNHYYMPLYPLQIAIAQTRTAAIVVDIAFSALFVLVVAKLAEQLFQSKETGRIAAFLTTFYPFFIFYSFSLLTETLYLFLLVLMFMCLYQNKVFLSLLVAVLSILVKPVSELFIIPMLVVYHLIVRREGLKPLVKSVGLFLFLYGLLLAPWWVHNYAKYDQFVRLTLADGVVLYSGNNPLNKSGGGIGGVDVDLTLFDSIKDPVERNRAMKHKAFDFIKENPGHFVKMSFVKLGRLWRPWPYAEQFASLKFVLISALSFVPILLSAIISVFRMSRELRRKCLPLFLFMLYLSLIHMVTIGSIRYRLPLEPLLIVLASYSLKDFIFQKKEQRHGLGAV